MAKLLLNISLAAAIILGGLALSTSVSYGKAEYTKKEGKGCTFCHTAAGKKDLNDVGKCYGEHGHSLESCEPKK
jgi:hypothetical protein